LPPFNASEHSVIDMFSATATNVPFPPAPTLPVVPPFPPELSAQPVVGDVKANPQDKRTGVGMAADPLQTLQDHGKRVLQRIFGIIGIAEDLPH
jgi:hypothetical protein